MHSPGLPISGMCLVIRSGSFVAEKLDSVVAVGDASLPAIQTASLGWADGMRVSVGLPDNPGSDDKSVRLALAIA